MKRVFIASAALTVSMLVGFVSTAIAAETDAAVISEAKDYVKKVSGTPSTWPGPKTSPKVAQGKSVTIISCAQASNGSVDAQAAYDAALELGWKPTIIDGKGDHSLSNAALRSAASATPSAITRIR